VITRKVRGRNNTAKCASLQNNSDAVCPQVLPLTAIYGSLLQAMPNLNFLYLNFYRNSGWVARVGAKVPAIGVALGVEQEAQLSHIGLAMLRVCL